MIAVTENVGNAEKFQRRNKAFERARGHFGHRERPDLQKLERLALGAELTTRVDDDSQIAI